jgi:hypothetical protein
MLAAVARSPAEVRSWHASLVEWAVGVRRPVGRTSCGGVWGYRSVHDHTPGRHSGPGTHYDAPPVTNVLTGTVALPDGFPDGTLTLIVSLPQQHDSTSATLAVHDTRPPSVSGAVTSIGLPFSERSPFAHMTVAD